jgi:hypothetical protein
MSIKYEEEKDLSVPTYQLISEVTYSIWQMAFKRSMK